MGRIKIRKVLLQVYILQLFIVVGLGRDTLYPGQSIAGDQRLTSRNVVFTLGFHIDYVYYLQIWYDKLPEHTIVWDLSVNTQDFMKLEDIQLTLSLDGNLTINDTDHRVIWSSNSSSSPNSTILVLQDNGNLVLKSISDRPNNIILWQSFDHPSDTWLPGAKLGFNKLTNSQWRIQEFAVISSDSPNKFGAPITSKADVYSYGMMLFEIISGRRNWSVRTNGENDYFPIQVMQKLMSDEDDVTSLIDSKLVESINSEELIRTCRVAGWCIQENEEDRLSMINVVRILEGVAEVINPPIPRFLQHATDNPEDTRAYYTCIVE